MLFSFKTRLSKVNLFLKKGSSNFSILLRLRSSLSKDSTWSNAAKGILPMRLSDKSSRRNKGTFFTTNYCYSSSYDDDMTYPVLEGHRMNLDDVVPAQIETLEPFEVPEDLLRD